MWVGISLSFLEVLLPRYGRASETTTSKQTGDGSSPLTNFVFTGRLAQQAFYEIGLVNLTTDRLIFILLQLTHRKERLRFVGWIVDKKKHRLRRLKVETRAVFGRVEPYVFSAHITNLTSDRNDRKRSFWQFFFLNYQNKNKQISYKINSKPTKL